MEEKARILVESLRAGANISAVARRTGLSPQQLFGWRREVRCDPAAGRSGSPGKTVRKPDPPSPVRKRGRSKKSVGGAPGAGEASAYFAPIVIAAASAAAPPPAGGSPPDRSAPGTIEIMIGDAVVRVSGQVDVALLAPVRRAVAERSHRLARHEATARADPKCGGGAPLTDEPHPDCRAAPHLTPTRE